MRLIWTITKRLLAWIFPVFLFDGCLNRDPYLKIDDHYIIGANCSGCPLSLNYRNSSIKWDEESAGDMSREEWDRAFEAYRKRQLWHLDDITDYMLSDAAIIGRSPKGWFIADQRSGDLRLFESSAQRDEALRKAYHLDDLNSFVRPSALMQMKSNGLWPWVHLYYAACFILVPSLTFARNRSTQKQLLDIRARQS